MGNILRKELRLSASPLSWFFLLFGGMFFLPGYPVVCGAFFVCLGIFQSFQSAREANDLVFSALLPVAKGDVVRGKYLFVCLIQLCGGLIMAGAAVIRMTALSDAPVYRSNAMMNANFFALGWVFVVFALFNGIFVRGFFRTGHKFARPFVGFTAAAFLAIAAAETAHHIPALSAVNAFGGEHMGLQLLSLALGLGIYAAVTLLSCRSACKSFERIDL